MVNCTNPTLAPVYRYLAIINSTECRSCVNYFPIPVKNITVGVWQASH